MLDISTEFKNAIFNDNRKFLLFVDITLLDGTILNLTKDDIWENSFKIEDSTSESNRFTIGAAVTGKLTLMLNNIYNDFSKYDFAKAEVIAYIGMQLSNTLEKVRVGTYIVDDASYDGATISLSCLDYMTKFDKPYSESSLNYPATLGQILQDVSICCEVSLISANFPNKDYLVQNRPEDDALTFGDIVAMAAQISGCWAKMDAYGRLKLDWYNIAVFEQNRGLNGGALDTIATPYEDGDFADGGDFEDYSGGHSVDGGTFKDQVKYHHIFSTKSLSVSTDDVVITGVRVIEEFDETEQDKKETFFIGQEGYLVEISGNSLIQKGQAQAVAKYLYERVGGMCFRPLDVECLTNPAIEAGDIAYVTDRKQNTYQSFISARIFNLGGVERITCDAETPSKNSAKSYSNLTKAIVKARNETKQQINAYNLAVQQLTNLITQSFGVFKTEEKLADGSVIYYMHNKPELINSSIIWKMTANAFAVSTDSGKTWNAGMDSSGNAIVSVLNATGINADWIKAGTINALKYHASGKVIKYASDYNEADMPILKNLVLHPSEITPEDLEKYDLDGDGILTSFDMAKLKLFLLGILEKIEHDTSLSINPNAINILTTKGVAVGPNHVTATNVIANNTYVHKIYVPIGEDMMLSGDSGEFVDANGKRITVTKGIITSIY